MNQSIAALAEKTCVPCSGAIEPLHGQALTALHAHLEHGWELVNEHHLTKAYKFKDFSGALAFVNRVGAIAEEQNHHPEIELGWGRAAITIFTHKIDGLTESDFVFAAKTEQASHAV